MSKKKEFEINIKTMVLIVLFIAFAIYTLIPQLREFRTSIYGHIINNILVFGLCLYLTISKKINVPVIGKIIILIFDLLYLICSIINLKIEGLFFLIYSIINLVVFIFVYKKTKIAYKSIILFGVFSYLIFVSIIFRIKYINGDMNPKFLIPSIVVTTIVFTICLLYSLKNFKLDKEKLICVPLLGLILGFSIPFLTISSINVYLDKSSPLNEEFTIIDKSISSGAKRTTTYNLKVKKGETTFSIGVDENIYYKYNIDDLIVLSIYTGTFNEPYYIFLNQYNNNN